MEKEFEILEMVKNGGTYSQIKKALKTSTNQIAKVVRKYEVNTGGGPGSRKIYKCKHDWKEINIYYHSGDITVRDCIKRFNFCSSSWSKAVKRGDVKQKPKRISFREIFKKK